MVGNVPEIMLAEILLAKRSRSQQNLSASVF